jgi:hypothetical protein
MKTLKLVGLQTYIAPFTKFNVIRKGDIVIVDDHHADRMMEGKEATPERGPIPHWAECLAGTRATYDFSTIAVAAVADVPAAPVAPTADEEEAAKRVAAAAADAHDEEVTLRLKAQADADAANPPPAPVEVAAPAAKTSAKAKGQRVARSK